MLLIRWSRIYPQLCIVDIYSRDFCVRCSTLYSYNISIQHIREFKGFRNSWDIAAMNISFVFTATSACSISNYCLLSIYFRVYSWFLTSNTANKSAIISWMPFCNVMLCVHSQAYSFYPNSMTSSSFSKSSSTFCMKKDIASTKLVMYWLRVNRYVQAPFIANIQTK